MTVKISRGAETPVNENRDIGDIERTCTLPDLSRCPVFWSFDVVSRPCARCAERGALWSCRHIRRSMGIWCRLRGSEKAANGEGIAFRISLRMKPSRACRRNGCKNDWERELRGRCAGSVGEAAHHDPDPPRMLGILTCLRVALQMSKSSQAGLDLRFMKCYFSEWVGRAVLPASDESRI